MIPEFVSDFDWTNARFQLAKILVISMPPMTACAEPIA